MSTVTEVKAGESIIGGLFVGGLFIAVTAVLLGWVSRNTSFFNQSTLAELVRQIAFGALFIFILAILANYKVLDFMEDHAYGILKTATLFFVISLVGFFILLGGIMMTQTMAGLFPLGIGLVLSLVFYLMRHRIERALRLSAEWLSIAAGIVLAEPGMIFLSIFQSFVMGITVITEIITIWAWNGYADSAAIDPQLQNYIQYIIGFVYLLFTFFILYYFDGAVIFMAYQRIKKRDPTVKEGISAATSRIPAILGFAFITTVVKTIVAWLRNLGRQQSAGNRSMQAEIFGFVLQMIASIGEWVYHMISFFTLPIIILRKKGTMNSMRESRDLFSQHLWNVVLSDMGFGFGTFIMYMLTAMLLAIGGFAYGFSIASIYALGSGVGTGIVVALLALIFGLTITKFFIRPLYTTFVTTIYVYASEGPDGLKAVSSRLKDQIGSSLQNPKAIPRGVV